MTDKHLDFLAGVMCADVGADVKRDVEKLIAAIEKYGEIVLWESE